MPDDANSDESQEESGADKAEKFTKRQFKEPMESLSSALRELCVNLNNPSKNSLLLDKVMIKYNGIARMTSHGGQLQLIHHDGDDNDASSNDDDESDNADDKSSQGSLSSSDSSKHDSGDGSGAESSKGGNGTAESDRVEKTTLGDQVKGHNDIVEYA